MCSLRCYLTAKKKKRELTSVFNGETIWRLMPVSLLRNTVPDDVQILVSEAAGVPENVVRCVKFALLLAFACGSHLFGAKKQNVLLCRATPHNGGTEIPPWVPIDWLRARRAYISSVMDFRSCVSRHFSLSLCLKEKKTTRTFFPHQKVNIRKVGRFKQTSKIEKTSMLTPFSHGALRLRF